MKVKFIKKDGSLRTLCGRQGVNKHLAGGKATVNKEDFFIFWDSAAEGYRAVNKRTLVEVKVNGKIYSNDN